MRCVFISHPDVVIDPAVPVPEWHLSERGVAKMKAFAVSDIVRGVTAVVSSAEVKAVESGAILGEALGVTPSVERELHENDRSATGFLPPPEFEAVANEFFARPSESVRGWERAIDAQTRVVRAVERVITAHRSGDLALVGHGGVGTLLICHLAGFAIDRRHDQPRQGCYFVFELATRRLLHGWRPLEHEEGA